MHFVIIFESGNSSGRGSNPAGFESHVDSTVERLMRAYSIDGSLRKVEQSAPSNALGMPEVIQWVIDHPMIVPATFQMIRHLVSTVQELLRDDISGGKVKIRIDGIEYEIDRDYESLDAALARIKDLEAKNVNDSVKRS